MKTLSRSYPVVWAALATVAVQIYTSDALAAGYKKADKTGASIAQFRDEIVNIKQQVESAITALDKVVETADSDPRKAFKEYDKAVPRVEEAATKAKKRSEEMKERGKAYFEQWEQELANLNDPEIRKLAQQRKAKLQGTFEAIRSKMEPVRDQFNAMLSGMKDLQTYLSSDLSINGIDRAKEPIAKTKTSAEQVQLSLDQVIAELNTIAATLTPAKVK